MNPIKIIRKLLKTLRGGATFSQMFFGCFLGVLLGMIPGVNMSFLILLFLLLILNVNGGLAGLGFIVGKVLCLLLAPVTFHVGYFLIHTLGLSGMVKFMSDTPVLAMMDFQVYCLLGGIPFSLILGGALAWFLARMIVRAREGIVATGQKSEKFRKLGENKAIKILLRIAVGKQKESMEEMLKEKKVGLFKMSRVIAGLVLIGLVVILQFFFLDSAVASVLRSQVGATNGAEVNVASVNLSLATGRLEIKGMQVTDPKNPAYNTFQAETLVADVSVKDLLTKRLTVELLEADQVVLDAKRAKPGEVYGKKPAVTEEKPEGPLPEGMSDAQKFAEYKKQFDSVKEKVDKLKEFLNKEKGDPKEELKKESEGKGYLKLSAQEFLSKYPTWVVKEAKVGLVAREGLPSFLLVAQDCSSDPKVYGKKATLEVKLDPKAMEKIQGELVGQAKGLLGSGEQKDAGGVLGGLLGGDKKEAAPKEEAAPAEEKKDGGGLLKGLLGK